jgi:hypothetical protein
VTVVHTWIGWIWKKYKYTCCLLHEKGKYLKMTSCGPTNFEGDGLHLNLKYKKNKPNFLGEARFLSTKHYMAKLPTF